MDSDQASAALAPSRPDGEPEPIFEGTAPDVYADSIQMGMGPYGLALSFAVTDINNPQRRHYVATVRMSPQLAFAMTQLLRSALREAQEQGVGIKPPKAIMDTFKLGEEL